MKLCVEELCFAYGKREVLTDLSFELCTGELLSVLGPNGAGKSTLFRCMLGLLSPKSGSVKLDGREVSQLPPAALAKSLAYIPQSHNPAFHFTVFEMVLMGTTARVGCFSSPRAPQMDRALWAMERLGISHLKDRSFAAISGGERQLTLIARTLAQGAKLLIMDEPTADLDLGNAALVMQTLRVLVQEGYGVIHATHEPEQAYLYSDRLLALREGRLLAWGTPRELMDSAFISALYGGEFEVCSLREDRARVCLPSMKIK